jgi:hypothetical protein
MPLTAASTTAMAAPRDQIIVTTSMCLLQYGWAESEQLPRLLEII